MISKAKVKMPKEQLVEFRLMHGLKQKDLAEILGVTWQAVRLWELGDRDIPLTTSKVIVLFQKFPQLLREF